MTRAFACLLALLTLTAAAERTPPARRPAPAASPSQAARAAPSQESFPSLEAVEKDVARLVESARPCVVGVIVRSRLEPLLDSLGGRVRIESGPSGAPIARRIGSGVVLDTRGHIVTLASLVSGASEVFVQPATGDRIGASVKGVDEDSGLAVLALEPPRLQTGMQAIQFSDAGPLRPGSLVTSISSPFASATGGPAYSFGFVIGTGVSQGLGRRSPYIKFNSFTSPGAGGGPVFDSKGRLAGVLFAAGDRDRDERGDRGGRGHVIRWEPPARPAHHSQDADDDDGEDEADAQDDHGEGPEAHEAPEAPTPAHPAPPVWILKSLNRGDEPAGGTAYAVPSDVVRQVTEQIIRSGAVRRGWVGVKIEESEPGEIHLLSVVPGGPAERAGLRAGDRILSIDGRPVGSAGRLVARLSVSSPGDTIVLGIQRDSRAFDVSLALAESPETPFRRPLAPEVRAFRLRSPVLGVEVDVDTDDETRERLGAPVGVGLLVQKVYNASRAMRAGMKEGDILLEAMGETISDLEDLRRTLRRQGPQVMEIKVMRERREVTLKVPPDLGAPVPPAAPTPPPPPTSSRRPPT